MIKLIPVHKAYRYVELLYEILQERTTDMSISHLAVPTFAEHRKFVASDPYRHWYFAILDDRMRNNIVGTAYLTMNNEIGIQVRRDHQRQGYGRELLAKLLAEHKPLPAEPGVRQGQFVANINPANEASIKLFTGLGAKLIQHTYRFD